MDLTYDEFEYLYCAYILPMTVRCTLPDVERWDVLREKGLVVVQIPSSWLGKHSKWEAEIWVTDLGIEVIKQFPLLTRLSICELWGCEFVAMEIIEQLPKEELPSALSSRHERIRFAARLALEQYSLK